MKIVLWMTKMLVKDMDTEAKVDFAISILFTFLSTVKK